MGAGRQKQPEIRPGYREQLPLRSREAITIMYNVLASSWSMMGPFPIYTCPSVEMHDSKSFILTVKVSKFYNIIKALKIDEQMGLIVQKSL